MKHTWWQRGETVVDSSALFRAHQMMELRRIRRELRRWERIQAWRRLKRWLRLASVLICCALDGCSPIRCNTDDYGFPLGEKMPPYPFMNLVENRPEYEKYLVEKHEPCGVVHQYFVTTDHDKRVLSFWRRY